MRPMQHNHRRSDHDKACNPRVRTRDRCDARRPAYANAYSRDLDVAVVSRGHDVRSNPRERGRQTSKQRNCAVKRPFFT